MNLTRHVALPRRVNTYALLFGLAAVACLGMASVVLSQSLHAERFHRAKRGQLQRAAAAVKLQLIRGEAAELSPLLRHMQLVHQLSFASLVSPAGDVMAHSSSELVGSAAAEPAAEVVPHGELSQLHFRDPEGGDWTEYRLPLLHGERRLGTLRFTAAAPPFWRAVEGTASIAPLAILMPLLLTVLGAALVQRIARPYEAIEEQLSAAAAAPSLVGFQIEQVESCGAAAAGWNRLADARGALGESQLNVRLEQHQLHCGMLEEAVQGLGSGVAVADGGGKIVFANRVFAAFLGQSEEALIGEPVLERIGDPLGSDAQRLLEQRLAGGQTHAACEVQTGQTPRAQVWRVARRPLASSRSVWTIHDVTQQRLNDDVRRQFFDSASSQIRAPLAEIAGRAAVLCKQNPQDAAAVSVQAEAARLVRRVDDLLTLGRLEAGTLSVAAVETDVERLAQQLADDFQEMMVQRQLRFSLSLPQRIPSVPVDSPQLAVAAACLLDNAAKYTPAGGDVTLRLRLNENELCLEVQDSGIGVPEDELPQIFNKHFRGSHADVREQEGIGIGLTLAHEIARLHGGELMVSSEVGVGSTFTLVIPLG